MRETTMLIADVLPIQLAELVESYILPTTQVNAGLSGHWESASQINDPAGLAFALQGAAESNNLPMITMLIGIGALHGHHKYACLSGAVRGGHVALANAIIKFPGEMPTIMSSVFPTTIEMLEWALRNSEEEYHLAIYSNAFNLALVKRNSGLVTYCITHSVGELDIDVGLYLAASGGDRGLTLLMLHLGGDVNEGLRGACAGYNVSLAKRMISRGADNWNDCLSECSEHIYDGKYALAELMIHHGASNICSIAYQRTTYGFSVLNAMRVSEWMDNKFVRPCSACGFMADEHALN